MAAHRIAVMPGDGIGKEVVPEGQRVLEAAAQKFGVELRVRAFRLELRLLREARDDDARGLVRAPFAASRRSTTARSAGRRRCPITCRCGDR